MNEPKPVSTSGQAVHPRITAQTVDDEEEEPASLRSSRGWDEGPAQGERFSQASKGEEFRLKMRERSSLQPN